MAKEVVVQNSTGKYWLFGILAIIVLLVLWTVGVYNGLVSKSEAVDNTWADVEADYQRRFDLIPNLVSTVKGYAEHEKGLFEKVTELRSQWGAAKSARNIDGQIAAATQLESTLKSILLVAENYPQLKASENFLSLQDELAGTENRIGVSRKRFNDAVKVYNVSRKRFPSNIIANTFGFEEKKFFEAAAGAGTAPKVEF